MTERPATGRGPSETGGGTNGRWPGVRAGLASALPLLTLPALFVGSDPPPPLRVFQVFAGPLAVLGTAAFGLACLASAPRVAAAAARFREQGRSWLAGRRGVVLVFLIALAALSLVRAQLISSRADDPRREYLLTGDEPSYLLLTHSLVFDGDLNLYNNREQNDGRYFYSRPLLGPGQFGFAYYNRLADGRLSGREAEWVGREYLINRPGLPILIAPAYWLGFHAGLRIRFAVLVWLNVMGAAVVALMFLLARTVSGEPVASAGAAFLLGFTPPLLYYPSQIFPEIPGALFLTGALYGLLRGQGRPAVLIVGLLLGFLPWLQERFLGTTAVLLGAGLARAPVRRHVVWLAAPVALSLLLQARYYWEFYAAPLPLGGMKLMAAAALPRGLLAMLTDRDRGILLINPLLIVAGVGLGFLWYRARWLAATIVAVLLVYLSPVAAFADWHGGVCPPLRYVTAVTPLLVGPLVVLLTAPGWPLTRLAIGVLGAWALWLGVTVTSQPALLFWKYGAVFNPSALRAAHPFFPGYFHPSPGSVGRSLLWLALLAAWPMLDAALGRAGASVTGRRATGWFPLILAVGLLAVSLGSAALSR